MNKCYYDILEVSREASQEDIQKSFRKLVKIWHPDICKHSNAEAKIKEINEAYDTLKDIEKRKSYNIQRGYALNKNTAKEDFKYKYDYKRGNFTKEKTGNSSEFKRENDTYKKEYTQNQNEKTFNRENYDLVYNVIKKYIMETQIKAESLKFPDINLIKISEKSGIFFIEGYFTSKNWVEQTIKTNYSAKVTSQFKLLNMDFLKTEVVYEQTKEKTKSRKTKKNVDGIKKKPFFLSLQFFVIFIITLIVFLVTYNKPISQESNTSSETYKVSDTNNNINEKSLSDNKKSSVNKNFIIFGETYFKDTLNTLIEKKDVDNTVTRNFAVELASKSPGSYNVGQIASIYDYIYKNWKYVSDPTGKEYFSKASETIENNLSGDCDDFAILLSSCIEAIGGKTRIVFAQSSLGGHAYTEVRISNNEEEAKKLIQSIGNYINTMYGQVLRSTYNYRKDADGTVWLNLDWDGPSPGAEYFASDKEVIFDTLDNKYTLVKGF